MIKFSQNNIRKMCKTVVVMTVVLMFIMPSSAIINNVKLEREKNNENRIQKQMLDIDEKKLQDKQFRILKEKENE